MRNRTDHEAARETLWSNVVAAAIRADNSIDGIEPINIADVALMAFDKRFGPEPLAKRDEKHALDETLKKIKVKKVVKKA